MKRTEGIVSYIPLSLEEGLHVAQLTEPEFDGYYKPIPNYPIERAAILYYQYACSIGATPEALSFIGRYVEINHTEIEMANARKNGEIKTTPAPARDLKLDKRVERVKASEVDPKMAPKVGRPKKDPAKPSKKKKLEIIAANSQAAKKLAAVPEVETPEPKRPVSKKAVKLGARTSAADLFKTLIMQGKLTDEEIFRQVQKEYNLEEKKRSYVTWYRNDLRKRGMNPPKPIKEKN